MTMKYVEPTLENYRKLTKEDFTVEKSEGTYGPIWVIRLKDEENGAAYVLRSAEKMEPFKGSREKPGIHLDLAYGKDPLRSSSGYKGIYRTIDMEKAFEDLIYDLNRNQQLKILEYAIESVLNDTSEKIRDLQASFEGFSFRDAVDMFESLEENFEKLVFQYRTVSDQLDNL